MIIDRVNYLPFPKTSFFSVNELPYIWNFISKESPFRELFDLQNVLNMSYIRVSYHSNDFLTILIILWTSDVLGYCTKDLGVR